MLRLMLYFHVFIISSEQASLEQKILESSFDHFCEEQVQT